MHPVIPPWRQDPWGIALVVMSHYGILLRMRKGSNLEAGLPRYLGPSALGPGSRELGMLVSTSPDSEVLKPETRRTDLACVTNRFYPKRRIYDVRTSGEVAAQCRNWLYFDKITTLILFIFLMTFCDLYFDVEDSLYRTQSFKLPSLQSAILHAWRMRT